ncbi:MAG: dUTP diphosphatase [Chitinispirillaceae bacterium]|nr:dUTP diphosphatase [Chitinispirillaceae bacterium]
MSQDKPDPIIKIKRLPHAEGLPLPEKKTSGASGFDVCAALEEDLELLPNSRALIPTGFCFEIPEGYELQVRPRSGLAVKYGITVLNSPGTIDSDYRGEVQIILINLGPQPVIIKRGDRIAQLVPAKILPVTFSEEKELTSSNRGEGGFGHTGI